MNSIGTKSLIGVLTAGTIATGVVFANLSDSYESHLQKQGRELITEESDKWNTIKSKYSEEGDGLLITIDNEEIAKGSLEIEQLKKWCSDNSKNKFTDAEDEIYQRVAAWCTVPKTIKEQIGINKRILDDKEPVAAKTGKAEIKNDDTLLWTRKTQAYNTSDNNKLIKDITANNKEEKEFIKASTMNETKLRAWCKFSKDKHFKHEEDWRYKSYLHWCVE